MTIIAVIYRPRSAPVQQLFFDELGAVLEQLATYLAPVYIAGDFIIHLEHPDDPHSVQLCSLVNCFAASHGRHAPTRRNTLRCDHDDVDVMATLYDPH